jgi:hypothetical protein
MYIDIPAAAISKTRSLVPVILASLLLSVAGCDSADTLQRPPDETALESVALSKLVETSYKIEERAILAYRADFSSTSSQKVSDEFVYADLVTTEEDAALRQSASELLRIHPELGQMSQKEIATFMTSRLTELGYASVRKSNCEANCSFTFAATITAINVAFVASVSACGPAAPGCAVAALVVKESLTAAAVSTLINCVNGCDSRG